MLKATAVQRLFEVLVRQQPVHRFAQLSARVPETQQHHPQERKTSMPWTSKQRGINLVAHNGGIGARVGWYLPRDKLPCQREGGTPRPPTSLCRYSQQWHRSSRPNRGCRRRHQSLLHLGKKENTSELSWLYTETCITDSLKI